MIGLCSLSVFSQQKPLSTITKTATETTTSESSPKIESAFKIEENGLTDFIVTPVNMKAKEEIFKKTAEWVNKNYKTSKIDTENQQIKFEGITNNVYCTSTWGEAQCSKMRYTIDVFFKDNRYKFDLVKMESNYKDKWMNLELKKSEIYTNTGELRTFYKHIEKVPAFFNDLNKSLKEYIEGEQKNKNDDW